MKTIGADPWECQQWHGFRRRQDSNGQDKRVNAKAKRNENPSGSGSGSGSGCSAKIKDEDNGNVNMGAANLRNRIKGHQLAIIHQEPT